METPYERGIEVGAPTKSHEIACSLKKAQIPLDVIAPSTGYLWKKSTSYN